jgi:SAM-dependent methyltransferase
VIKTKRNNWFNNYQEIPQLKINGMRTLSDRISLYNPEDFINASILDLGCNTGQMCFQSKEWGATHILGVDFDVEAIKKAKQIAKELGVNVNFVADDLDSNFFWNSINPADVVLFLSVIDTKEIKNRYGILSKTCAKTKKVLYFEGHDKVDEQNYLRHLLDYTDFTTIQYLGTTPNTRPFFRCSREVLSSDECVQKILELKHKKIAVVGKGLSGKSVIRKKLLQHDAPDLKIIDDLYICNQKKEEKQLKDRISIEQLKTFERFILFDYRALKYYKEFDVVFFVTPNENLIGQSRNEKLLRSPYISKDCNKIKEIHTVRSY